MSSCLLSILCMLKLWHRLSKVSAVHLLLCMHSCAPFAQGHSVAVQFAKLAGDDTDSLEKQFYIFRGAANLCQMHPDALKARGRSWRDKAAVYRQHAFALLRRMGRPAPSDSATCFLCHEKLDAEQPMDHLDPHTGVVINECGHVLHILCQVTWGGVRKPDCAVCAATK